MTLQEARALAISRIVSRILIPAMTGIELKQRASGFTTENFDALAAFVRDKDDTAAGALLRSLLEISYSVDAAQEVDSWVADSCVPPVRMAQLL